MSCILVIGTGRSGTSLLMQALEQLGVHIDPETVPPSPTNPRGTGEAIAVRDQMQKLYEVFRGSQGFQKFRPADWQENILARQASDWLVTYLSEQQAEAGTGDFAIKFPLASLFIPLWIEAAKEADISLKCVWATRQAPQMIDSMISAYGGKQERHQRVWAQRTYYILRDAPSETPLLRFEDWASNPHRQISVISQLCDISHKSIENLVDIYAPYLDHSKGLSPEDIPEPIRIVDDLIQRNYSTVEDIRKSDETEFFHGMTKLSDMIVSSRTPSEAQIEEENEMRIELLKRLANDSGKRLELEPEIGIIGERLQEMSVENQRLRKLTQEHGAENSGSLGTDNESSLGAARNKIKRLTQDKEELIGTIKNIREKLKKSQADQAAQAEKRGRLEEKVSEARAYAKELESREAYALEKYAELSKARDRLEEDIEGRNRYRLGRSESKVAQLQDTSDKLRKQLAQAKEKLVIERKKLAERLEGSEIALAQARLENEEFLNSTSWRITSPLRKVSIILRRT